MSLYYVKKVDLSSLLIACIYHPMLLIVPCTLFVQSDAAALCFMVANLQDYLSKDKRLM